MDLLNQYSDNNDPDSPIQNPNSPENSSPPRLLPSRSAAPKVDDTMLALTVADPKTLSKPIDPTQHAVGFNPTYDQLWAPIQGPSHPYAKDGLAQGMRNHKLGFVEDANIEPFLFDEQHNTFLKFGYASDPSASNYIGDFDALQKNNAASVYNMPHREQKKRRIEALKKKEENDDEEDDNNAGEEGVESENPASEAWLLKNKKSPWAGKKEGLQGELTEDQKKYAEEYAKKKGEEKSGFGGEKVEAVKDKSTFHGKEERDYQGRSWIAPPKDAKASNDHCYIPKRLVHTWSGHTKGVSAIRFFPKAGHLILSAGMDTKVKIWDVFNTGKCMRTYMGHSKAVRDICFTNDGTKFLSAGYDKNIKYWDTETGQVISTFSTGKIPYVVKLNPDEDKQNVLLAGMSDKKIVQWDMNTGQITQEYDQHLGAVNTITFVDNNRRFVTSSDDKSLRVWEDGIPVVIKYISELLDFKPGGVNSLIQVTDLKDMPRKELRTVSNEILTLFQDNYPEMVAHKIFINVPWYFSMLYAIYCPFLTQRTKSKFVISKEGNATETLYKFIRPENIPVQYGGLSRPSDFQNGPPKPASEFTVKGGEKVNIQIEGIESGATIKWEIVVGGWEVQYSAEFVPNAESSYTIAVDKARKVEASEEVIESSFTSKEGGIIVLSVDNSGSRKKKVGAYRYVVPKCNNNNTASDNMQLIVYE